MDVYIRSVFQNPVKYVILLLDEMHIKESLVYDKHTGDLIGFTDLGEINSHLLALQQSLTDSKSFSSIASTVMTFMVRGLFSHLHIHYCFSRTGAVELP